MKKFKKPQHSRSKEKEDISSMVYWGCEGQCNIISASWDGVVRLFDDNDTAREG